MWGIEESADWRSVRYCVVDIETTGLDLRRDDVVSIGAVEIVEGRVTSHSFYQLVRPTAPLSPEAMMVHCLTARDLGNASRIDDVLPSFLRFSAGSVPVAHAAWVERAFLNRAIARRQDRLPRRMVDTAVLARRLDLVPSGSREPSLEALAIVLGLPVHTPHHALGDAATTAQIFLAMASRLRRASGGARVRDLLDACRPLPSAGGLRRP